MLEGAPSAWKATKTAWDIIMGPSPEKPTIEKQPNTNPLSSSGKGLAQRHKVGLETPNGLVSEAQTFPPVASRPDNRIQGN